MWVMVMFDLPSATGADRRRYVRFRKELLRQGFEMRQKSVYLRWEETAARADVTCNLITRISPAEGRVTAMKLTSRAMSSARTLVDRRAEEPLHVPDEFLLC